MLINHSINSTLFDELNFSNNSLGEFLTAGIIFITPILFLLVISVN